MKHCLIALGILAIAPFTSQAAHLAGSQATSGTVRFTGSITTPACSVRHQNDRLISTCFDRVADNKNGYISWPLHAMPPELVSNVTSEAVNNKPGLKRVIISYK